MKDGSTNLQHVARRAPYIPEEIGGDKKNVFGLFLDPVGEGELEARVMECVSEGGKKRFSYANAHASNLASSDPVFRALLNRSDVTYCDGEGLRLAARLLGVVLPPRATLTRWVWPLCGDFASKGISVFLLGSTAANVAQAEKNLVARFPGLRVVGTHHGYFPKRGPRNEQVLRCIAMARPDVLFVGFGMPAQEYWIEENFASIEASVVMPCGSMIDYVAGAEPVAPVWMARRGFEWLYRLCQHPRALWRRYLLGNPRFIFRVVAQLFRRKIFGHEYYF